jgi:hypothetical protein
MSSVTKDLGVTSTYLTFQRQQHKLSAPTVFLRFELLKFEIPNGSKFLHAPESLELEPFYP